MVKIKITINRFEQLGKHKKEKFIKEVRKIFAFFIFTIVRDFSKIPKIIWNRLNVCMGNNPN